MSVETRNNCTSRCQMMMKMIMKMIMKMKMIMIKIKIKINDNDNDLAEKLKTTPPYSMLGWTSAI